MKNVIFVAPPAAGKGTCSEELVKKFNYKHISTGDLLREAKMKGDELGQEIAKLIDSGQFVSDEIVLALLQRELENMDKNQAFILDGYPRNLNQANTLDKLFDDLKINEYIVIYLNIDFEKALERTLGRMLCPNCKRGYNKYSTSLKPKVDNICDDCQTTLVTRSDDTEETFKLRFDTYMKETNPIIKYYQDKNLLKVIDADQNINDIIDMIEGVIK